MKKYTLIFVLITFCFHLNAQSYLKTAKGTSGILMKNGLSNLSFDLADSKLAFSLRWDNDATYHHTTTPTEIKNAQKLGISLPAQIDFSYLKSQNIINLSFGAFENGKLGLFSNNTFTPNAELSYTKSLRIIYNSTQDNIKTIDFFARPAISILRREHILPTIIDSSYVQNKTSAIDLSFALGVNWYFTEDKILSISSTAVRMWNSDNDLKKKTICIQDESSVNSLGQIVQISDCKELPFGDLNGITYLDLRADYLWRPHSLQREGRESIGFLGAFSSILTKDNDPSFNFAIGPAVFDKDNPGNIIFSVMLEMIDFNKVNPSTESFQNIFGVRAYLGLPLSKLNFKATPSTKTGNTTGAQF